MSEGKISMPSTGGAVSESSDYCQHHGGLDTDGEHQGPRHHHCRTAGLASAGSLRSSTDGGSDSDTHCRSSSFCSRRKQLSPRRSPYL
jgi:hypothetical protein